MLHRWQRTNLAIDQLTPDQPSGKPNLSAQTRYNQSTFSRVKPSIARYSTSANFRPNTRIARKGIIFVARHRKCE